MMKAKERPIIFNAEMVRAIMAGTKTQTRRVIKPQPEADHIGSFGGVGEPFAYAFEHEEKWRYCPYGGTKEKLWVRETWAVAECFDSIKPSKLNLTARNVEYRAEPKKTGYLGLVRGKWRPSIFMPRWSSRITLEIADVRVERLQDITEEDAKAEGVKHGSSAMGHVFTHKEHFRGLWNGINGKKHPWESNPWVWVVEFKKI